MSGTLIAVDKLRAYAATDYRLGHTDQDIVLNIGKRSDRLAALFADTGFKCGAFLTAYNPQGSIQSDVANARGHAELASKLQELGLEAIEGSSRSNQPGVASALLRHFGGLFYVRKDADPPR